MFTNFTLSSEENRYGQSVFTILSDINECSTGTPCNGGTCLNTPGTFSCDCTGTGFEGPTCTDRKFFIAEASII